MAVMIFQASIFRSFQKIYEMKEMPQFKELVKFSNYIIREFVKISEKNPKIFIEFVKISEKNPKIFIETLFWKSSRDAYDAEEGYGSYHKKSEAASKGWTELEEDELRRLFVEYQEKLIEEDIVDWILNNLIDNTRTRRGVLKKLKEMYLLTEYKGRSRPANNNRPPRHWSEQEELQLRELFERFKDATDPLGCIMERLEVKRPKNRIVEKLLVMGLVQDKKELRKKRAKKSHGGEESDPDSSDSDRDTIPHTTSSSNNNPNRKQRQDSRKVSQRKNKSSKQLRLGKNDLAKLLIPLIDSGMSDALEWLRESFTDAAEDIDVDPETDESGIPLVPILDCSVTAMEDGRFQNVLLAFGVVKPADEQETYWRLPNNLTSTILREHCDLISQALDGTLQIENEPTTQDNQEATEIQQLSPKPSQNYSVNEESSDDEYVFGSLRNKTINDEVTQNATSQDEDPSTVIKL
ncbi:Timeless PAB domain [Popillia japonica]|uniref:Timeless PAB domain n=1 Tax=Popillia japonica TaxID=7064 RepID=A0AAW1JI73_POPJA